ncbi:MAG: glycerol acyltransferase [Bacteroidia bacterium]|nr:MAG: glycerol acyltransferase [Bacteroidia bacterium]
MITAKHNRLYTIFFDLLFVFLIHRHFRKVNIRINEPVGDGPVLLIANHFSWWDGFIARWVNNKVFHRLFHVMMLEEELGKRPFLRRLGAFSIRRNSRSAVESLSYGTKILSNPNHILLLFPQGKFQSSHHHPLQFEKGWMRIVDKAPPNTQIVYMACLSDYFAYRKPALTVYLKNIGQKGVNTLADMGRTKDTGSPAPSAGKLSIETSYNDFFKNCIHQQNLQVS